METCTWYIWIWSTRRDRKTTRIPVQVQEPHGNSHFDLWIDTHNTASNDLIMVWHWDIPVYIRGSRFGNEYTQPGLNIQFPREVWLVEGIGSRHRVKSQRSRLFIRRYINELHREGRIGSASILIAKYSEEYKHLVEIIYRDGRNSRWMFGWSGPLSCYSNLWTPQRIFFAMLDGLSLFAIQSSNSVTEEEMDADVRSLIVGYSPSLSETARLGNGLHRCGSSNCWKDTRKNLKSSELSEELVMCWKFQQRLPIWADCPLFP